MVSEEHFHLIANQHLDGSWMLLLRFQYPISLKRNLVHVNHPQSSNWKIYIYVDWTIRVWMLSSNNGWMLLSVAPFCLAIFTNSGRHSISNRIDPFESQEMPCKGKMSTSMEQCSYWAIPMAIWCCSNYTISSTFVDISRFHLPALSLSTHTEIAIPNMQVLNS